MPTPIAQRPLEYLFSVSSVDAMKIRVQNGHSKQFETETTARTQRNITQNIECPQNKTKWREERKTKYWKRKSAIIWARTWVQNTKEKRATGEWADINGHDMAWTVKWRLKSLEDVVGGGGWRWIGMRFTRRENTSDGRASCQPNSCCRCRPLLSSTADVRARANRSVRFASIIIWLSW